MARRPWATGASRGFYAGDRQQEAGDRQQKAEFLGCCARVLVTSKAHGDAFAAQLKGEEECEHQLQRKLCILVKRFIAAWGALHSEHDTVGHNRQQ